MLVQFRNYFQITTLSPFEVYFFVGGLCNAVDKSLFLAFINLVFC